MYAVSVDIGGTQTRVACIDSLGNIIDRQAFSTFIDDPIKNLNEINTIIKSFDKEFIGIGMSCPGPLDLTKGIVLTPPNLPGWHNFNLKAESEKIMTLPVFVENDANLAALAESQIGAGKGNKIVQYFTISTGIGGGLIIKDEIYNGAHGFAQEIANSILWKDGPQQSLLQKGSLESISSGTAILKRAKAAGLNVEHAGHVFDLAKDNNLEAQVVIKDAKEYLANMIATVIGILDPNIIVLGGGVALKTEGFIDEIQKLVVSKVYDVVKDHVNIVGATLGDDSGLIGGALHAFLKVKEV